MQRTLHRYARGIAERFLGSFFASGRDRFPARGADFSRPLRTSLLVESIMRSLVRRGAYMNNPRYTHSLRRTPTNSYCVSPQPPTSPRKPETAETGETPKRAL